MQQTALVNYRSQKKTLNLWLITITICSFLVKDHFRIIKIIEMQIELRSITVIENLKYSRLREG